MKDSLSLLTNQTDLRYHQHQPVKQTNVDRETPQDPHQGEPKVHPVRQSGEESLTLPIKDLNQRHVAEVGQRLPVVVPAQAHAAEARLIVVGVEVAVPVVCQVMMRKTKKNWEPGNKQLHRKPELSLYKNLYSHQFNLQSSSCQNTPFICQPQAASRTTSCTLHQYSPRKVTKSPQTLCRLLAGISFQQV